MCQYKLRNTAKSGNYVVHGSGQLLAVFCIQKIAEQQRQPPRVLHNPAEDIADGYRWRKQ